MSITTAELLVGDHVAAAYRNPVSPDYELTVDLGDGVFEAVALKTIDAHIQQGSVNTLHTDDSIQWVVFNRDETIFADPLGELPENSFVEDSDTGPGVARVLVPADLVGADKTEGQPEEVTGDADGDK